MKEAAFQTLVIDTLERLSASHLENKSTLKQLVQIQGGGKF